MAELVPILGGVLAGTAIGLLARGTRARLAWMVVASIAIGVFAGVISGELAESPLFLAIDVPGAFIAAGVALLTVDRVRGPIAQEPPQG